MDYILKCNDCDWTGDIEELKKITYDIDGFDYYVCPKCESMDTEDE